MAASRFASFDDEEFNKILEDRDAENTKRATKLAVSIFQEYLVEKGIDIDFQDVDKKTLSSVLAKFYVELRKGNGTHYKTATLGSIRGGINRHFKAVYNGIIDITKDPEFTNANVAYKAALVQLKKMGKGDVKHHESIDPVDIETLYNSSVFDQETPAGLESKVWFEISLYL